MKYLVCEGLNDSTLLYKIASNRFSKNPLIIDNMKKAQETFNYRNYNHLKDCYDLFIFKDNGRPYIYNKVVPRLLCDSWKRLKITINLLVIIDLDFQNPNNLKKNIFQLFRSGIESKKKDISTQIIGNSFLEITSNTNSTFKTIVHLFFIPKSLEQQLLDMCFQLHTKKIERCGITKSIEMNIHRKMYNVAKSLGFTKTTDLIDFALENKWFESCRWYQGLVNKLNSFLS